MFKAKLSDFKSNRSRALIGWSSWELSHNALLLPIKRWETKNKLCQSKHTEQWFDWLKWRSPAADLMFPWQLIMKVRLGLCWLELRWGQKGRQLLGLKETEAALIVGAIEANLPQPGKHSVWNIPFCETLWKCPWFFLCTSYIHTNSVHIVGVQQYPLIATLSVHLSLQSNIHMLTFVSCNMTIS